VTTAETNADNSQRSEYIQGRTSVGTLDGPSVDRKITAILAADIAGYSRLVREDEEDTLQRLDSCRAVFRDYITRFGGRIVDMAGDSVLAEFRTAIDAVRCAVDAQESLRTQNSTCPPGRQMNFRIGITIGDVLERDGFLLGEGVNIASRLQSIAPAGGICISRSVYEAVAHKISLKFADVGQHQLKNIPDRVHAYTAALNQTETRRKSLSGIASSRWLVWSVLGFLITAGLGTATYVLWSAEHRTPPGADQQAAARLDRCTIGDTDKEAAIAACTRLLERGESDPTRAASYFANRGDAFLKRGDIELALKDLDESLRLNPNAALANFNRGAAYFSKHDFEHAVTDLQRALALDPKHANSEYYLGRSLLGLGRPDEAVTHLTNAIGLDAKNEAFYRFRGEALLESGNNASALSDYNQALRLKPNSAEILAARANALLKGKNLTEAMRDIEQALSIDPGSAVALTTRGEINEALGRNDQAIADFKRALTIDGTIEGAKKALARLDPQSAMPW
jgi:class 3 adenylate cyclase/Tfp pilus assembly protein PilF